MSNNDIMIDSSACTNIIKVFRIVQVVLRSLIVLRGNIVMPFLVACYSSNKKNVTKTSSVPFFGCVIGLDARLACLGA